MPFVNPLQPQRLRKRPPSPEDRLKRLEGIVNKWQMEEVQEKADEIPLDRSQGQTYDKTGAVTGINIASGGSVKKKKYAHGGSVRKTKLSDY